MNRDGSGCGNFGGLGKDMPNMKDAIAACQAVKSGNPDKSESTERGLKTWNTKYSINARQKAVGEAMESSDVQGRMETLAFATAPKKAESGNPDSAALF